MRHVTRPMVMRIRYLLNALATKRTVRTNIVADQLEVSARTIARDLDMLINQFDLPIEYDRSHKTYRLTRELQTRELETII